jgi:penicillin-binding protein 2
MRVSCNWAVGMFLVGSLGCSVSAVALNAPRTLHRAKPPSLLRAVHRQLLCQQRHLRRRRDHRRRPVVVRQAAIDALGDMNGTAVVIDPIQWPHPGHGQPEACALARRRALLHHQDHRRHGRALRGSRHPRHHGQLPGFRMNMTQALAKSNNLYFEELGRELGFERVRHYANQFGLGRAGRLQHRRRAVGRLSRCGTSRLRGRRGPHVQLRPGRFAHSAATGRVCGRTRQRRNPLLPAAPHQAWKKHCALPAQGSSGPWTLPSTCPTLQEGMAGAVEYGTARRLRANFHDLPVFGKTGTCSDNGTRFGWFASFSDSPQGSLVTVSSSKAAEHLRPPRG